MSTKEVVGDIFAGSADAIVNPVNVREAVMGKGLAKIIATRWPSVVPPYRRACEEASLRIGTVLVTPVDGPAPLRAIIHMPTKISWRNPSRLEYIEAGLPALAQAIRDHGFRRVAIPALGCGLGDLSWTQVRPLLEQLGPMLPEVAFGLYAPHAPTPKARAR